MAQTTRRGERTPLADSKVSWYSLSIEGPDGRLPVEAGCTAPLAKETTMQVKAISAYPGKDNTTFPEDVAELFSRLYTDHYAEVRRYLYGRTHDWHLADELTQETFVKLWERIAVQGRDYTALERPMGLLVTMARWTLTGHRGFPVMSWCPPTLLLPGV